jgi:tetraacyldisaccharide 4'-kinase
MTTRLERRWYGATPSPLLTPLAALYTVIAARRRASTAPQSVGVPVIVVGNISVGGTGKTPVVQWLVQQLADLGLRPGVISRGYGGRLGKSPVRVTATQGPADVGDEPCLIAASTGVPVVIGHDRVAAARLLCDQANVNVIVADDGLQHYRLHRDIEICVVDGTRGLGNGTCLPAGPLREPPARLAEVDFILVNGGDWQPPMAAADTAWARFELRVGALRRLGDGQPAGELTALAGQRAHALAGIGRPARFFEMLTRHGLKVEAQAFPDHHAYTAADFATLRADTPILMTEKDAVKARGLAPDRSLIVPVTVDVQAPALIALLQQRLDLSIHDRT